MALNYERGDLGERAAVSETTCGLFEAKRTTRGRRRGTGRVFGHVHVTDQKANIRCRNLLFGRVWILHGSKISEGRKIMVKNFQDWMKGDGVDTDLPFTEFKMTFWYCIHCGYR